MSTYQNEIFNYLTKKDNFYSAYDIYQIFPEVKNTLVEQFWLRVKIIVEELSKDKDWNIKISDNVFDTYSSLAIFIHDSFQIAFERLHGQIYYGLWIDYNNKKLDRPKINKYAAKIEAINHMKKSDWWIGWEYTGANFNNIETLIKILPDNKEDYAQELANQLFDLSNELQNDVDNMSKMTID